VLACNTATAVAVHELRTRWPHIPVVGVEPGIKPALHATRNGHIGVMATPSTLRSDKFKRLLATHSAGAHIHLQACPGLAALIEQGDLNAPALVQLIEHLCLPLKAHSADTVVLGCTHYPFVAPHIQAAMGEGVTLIDTALAVARQAARLLSTPAHAEPVVTPVQLQTTGDVDHLRRVAARWLGFACDVRAAPAGL
jgi:glutamate racemase